MSNAMSLKAKIRNIAKQKNIPAQVILQNYMFERLLVRLATSAYKDKFVLKGGMLVAATVGLDNRATMDLDTTLKNLPLTPEAIRSAFINDSLSVVCNVCWTSALLTHSTMVVPNTASGTTSSNHPFSRADKVLLWRMASASDQMSAACVAAGLIVVSATRVPFLIAACCCQLKYSSPCLLRISEVIHTLAC